MQTVATGIRGNVGTMSAGKSTVCFQPRAFRRICGPDQLVFSSLPKANRKIYEADLRTECVMGSSQSLQASVCIYHGILQYGGNDPERSPALLVSR